MRARAKRLGRNPNGVPKIDHVIRDGSLAGIGRAFDAVVSSHSIEHQPDLIGHLGEVAGLLRPDGKYYLLIPHCSYCFDASLPPSKISDILTAEREGRKVHTLGSVVEHRAMTTHNEPLRHWQEGAATGYRPLRPEAIASAIAEYERADGAYIDVHAWQFTPITFADTMRCLIALKSIPFTNVSVNGPVYGRNEFTAILSR